MTIRFTLAYLFIHSSLIGTVLLGKTQPIVAHPETTTSLAQNHLSTEFGQQSLIALRLPFLRRRRKKKNPRETPSPDSNTNPNSREYIFRAPATTGQKQVTSYQVQVYGSDRELLRKVQAIEPKAFLKGNLIQVGAFRQQENAEELLQRLAIQGFWARIIVSK